jgi:hypothetical protein
MLHQLKHLKRNVALNDDMFLELVQKVEDYFEEYLKLDSKSKCGDKFYFKIFGI